MSGTRQIGFIGGGNMAQALIGGLLKQGFAAAQISVAEPNETARLKLTATFGVRCAADGTALAGSCETLVLAVKPQVMREVCMALAPQLASRLVQPLIISIAAGTRMPDIARWLGGIANQARIVRAMPNTPALVGKGIAGLCANQLATPADHAQAQKILEAVGAAIWVEDEALIDPVTAVSGSGPAYFFYFLEGMIAAGIDLGLSETAARQLAVHTCAGAAELARQSPEALATLRANVTSKGGTTQAALESMEADQVRAAIARAVKAASARGRELGDLLGAD